ncbi:UDP binding domain-containing protein [Streptomyces brasiliensis]|uniref:UDP-glucose/GDP-mannose dehydrogenase C-terminal domain-containing protein n=1 Tax=Streptomyces brasiliensis TaxID=1954 RepID=A0A917P2I3_9ACTN|nr:UDP binding domain-containing protein [Streptomyces brasiliensis]GGJ56606.1 hypothetical protein GCM10010121_079090 [Streptomyces brasiliensis]
MLLSAAIDVNNIQQRRAIQKLRSALGDLAGRQIVLFGMAFKPGTDDMREAPSTVLAARLLAEGASVRCWDPLARPAEAAPWRYASPEEALDGADAAVVVTEWSQLLSSAFQGDDSSGSPQADRGWPLRRLGSSLGSASPSARRVVLRGGVSRTERVCARRRSSANVTCMECFASGRTRH